MKLAVGLVTGSLGILAEAAHSGLDLVAALITFLAVRVSDKPADREHPYGHGKIENFSALIETVCCSSPAPGSSTRPSAASLFQTIEIDPSLWAFLVMVVSIGVDVSRSRMLFRAARKHHSQAWRPTPFTSRRTSGARAWSSADWPSSGSGRTSFPGTRRFLQKADAAAALGVAFIVLFVSYRLGKRTVDVLLDRAPGRPGPEDLRGRRRGRGRAERRPGPGPAVRARACSWT